MPGELIRSASVVWGLAALEPPTCLRRGLFMGFGARPICPEFYGQIRAGWALGDRGEGTLWLSNNKGVTMELKTHRRGLQLSLGADGVVIGFK